MATQRIFLILGALIFAGTAASHEPLPPNSVAVTGHSEVTVAPDRARLSLGVDVLKPELKAAETETSRIVRDYLVAAKKLGARDADLSSAGVSIQPDYLWDEKVRRQILNGYRVHRQIEVVVNDLNQLGDFILRATAAGVNQVNPPLLESSREKDLQQQALALAAKDARARAQVLAETLGAKLGAALHVNAADTPPPPVAYKRMAMAADAAQAAPDMGISPGEIRIAASVSAEFELLPP